MRARLLHARPHLVTFTSASTVDSFVQAVGDPGREELADTAYAVIGPITQAAADKHGMRVSVAPEQYDIPGLVAAVVDHYADPKDPAKEQA